MQPDDERSQGDSVAADTRRRQAQVSQLRQDVAVARAICRLERARYYEEREDFLELLPTGDEAGKIDVKRAKRLAEQIRKIKLREQRIEQFEKRLTEEEDALDQAEEGMHAAQDRTSRPGFITTPSTTQDRSDASSLARNDDSEEDEIPDELDQYLGLVEEIRLLREEYQNMQVDQIQEARKWKAVKETGERLQTSDSDLHQRHLKQREPLVRDLIAKTDRVKSLLWRCHNLGIEAPSLDELIPPLNSSGLSPGSTPAIPLALDFSAYETDHLHLSLVPMTSVDDRIKLWNLGVGQGGHENLDIPTALGTPRTALGDEMSVFERSSLEYGRDLEDLQLSRSQGSRHSFAHDVIRTPPRPHQRNAISVPNLSMFSTKSQGSQLPAQSVSR